MECMHCHTTEDLRPYGAGGAPICFRCMKSQPGAEKEAKRQLFAALEGHLVVVVMPGGLLFPETGEA